MSQSPLNYAFLAIVYTVLSLVGIALYSLEKFGSTETADSIKGYWIICAPCFPCALWAAFMNSKQSKLQLVATTETPSAPVDKKNQ